MVAGTKIFPDDDGGSDGKSIKEEDRHICDHRCGADGCQGVCPDEVSHYNGVNRIVEHLKMLPTIKGRQIQEAVWECCPGSYLLSLFLLEPLRESPAFNVKNTESFFYYI